MRGSLVTVKSKRKVSQWWDFDGRASWAAMQESVRVVRALETVPVRRQRTIQIETVIADWLWGTTLRSKFTLHAFARMLLADFLASLPELRGLSP